MVFPAYRLAIIVIAIVVAVGLWLLLDRTRLGAMIRAGVDDPDMARVVGIRVSQLFTVVFALGAGLAGDAVLLGSKLGTPLGVRVHDLMVRRGVAGFGGTQNVIPLQHGLESFRIVLF